MGERSETTYSLAGLGAVDAQAHRARLAFADKAGALLANYLASKGVFSSSRLFTWDGRGALQQRLPKRYLPNPI